jgi:chromosome segregation ATPase
MDWQLIILALIPTIPAVLTVWRQYRKDSLRASQDLIQDLSDRIDSLKLDLKAEEEKRKALGDDLDEEREKRRALEDALDIEKAKREAAEKKVSALEHRLQDATEARIDRIQRIQELEVEAKSLQAKVKSLQAKVAELEGRK